MGFSVSAAVAIFLIGFLVMASSSFTLVSNSAELVNDGRKEQQNRMLDELQTDINITSIDYNLTLQRLIIEVVNTGSIILDAGEVNLLIDGDLITEDIALSPAKVWIPEKTLTINVTSVASSPSRVKVVTENGISDYISV
ncbi:MAG: hypothetical protein SVM80_04595 [Halobacteriota archaeon]|nr:hypothetical protein [Halobacteriota archaeon]